MISALKPQLLCSPGVGTPEGCVRAIYDNVNFRRKVDDEYEKRIESVWKEKMKEKVTLYDKSKFRLHKARTEYPSDSNGKTVVLELGLTSYKEFIGTNCAPYGRELLNKRMGDEIPYGCDFLANPLGVGAILETADSKIVFLRRSDLCAESPGLIDMPGGHPEPDEVSLTGKDLDAIDSDAIVHEIFHSIMREVRDEVNIPERHLSDPLLLGICFNETTLYRPSAEFFMKCSLTSHEVLSKYKEQTHCEREESTDLIFLDSKSFREMDEQLHGQLWSMFTSSVKGAIQLFSVFST